MPELLVGVPFPAAAFGIVEFAAGAEKAQAAALTGKIFSAQKALEIGLADELAVPSTLVNYAISHAYRLASTVAADTFRLTKQHVRRLLPDPDYDREVGRIWQERATDGWIRDYMGRTVRRTAD